MPISDRDKQDLRHAVLKVFADRSIIPLTLESVCASTRRLIPFRAAPEDVQAAIEFHVSLEHLEVIEDEWGSETTWKITAKGTLAHERDPNKVL